MTTCSSMTTVQFKCKFIETHWHHLTYSCASFGSNWRCAMKISKIESNICYMLWSLSLPLDVAINVLCIVNFSLYFGAHLALIISVNARILCARSLWLCMFIYVCFVFAHFCSRLYTLRAQWPPSKDCLLSFVLSFFFVHFSLSLHFQKKSHK